MNELTSIPAFVAYGIFLLGLFIVALWQIEERRAERRRAVRFEAADQQARFDRAWLDIVAILQADEPTVDLPPIVLDEYQPRGLAEQAIEIPREGDLS